MPKKRIAGSTKRPERPQAKPGPASRARSRERKPNKGSVAEMVVELRKLLAAATDIAGEIHVLSGRGGAEQNAKAAAPKKVGSKDDNDQQYWADLIVQCNANITEMAAVSGMSRPTIHVAIRRLGLSDLRARLRGEPERRPTAGSGVGSRKPRPTNQLRPRSPRKIEITDPEGLLAAAKKHGVALAEGETVIRSSKGSVVLRRKPAKRAK